MRPSSRIFLVIWSEKVGINPTICAAATALRTVTATIVIVIVSCDIWVARATRKCKPEIQAATRAALSAP